METERKSRNARFDEQYTNIIFMILSVVQGLAFSDLAGRTATIIPTVGSVAGVTRLLHVVLCFCILLRIFQTYVTAGLDYKPEFISFRDVVIILLAGIWEYVIFQYLGGGTGGTGPGFQPVKFYWTTAILALLATGVYFVNIFRVQLSERDSIRDYYLERALQRANAAYMAGVFAVSVFAAATWPDGGPSVYQTGLGIVAPSACSILLIVSTANSLNKTFGLQFFFRSDERSAGEAAAAAGRSPPAGEGGYVVLAATRDQSADIADLCADRHEAALTTVFGLIRDESTTVLRQLIQGNVGTFSHRSFRVGTKGGKLVAAALLLKGRPSAIAHAVDAAKVAIHLGPKLGLRFRRRFKGVGLSQLPLRRRRWWLIPFVWSDDRDRDVVCRQIIAEVVEDARHAPTIEVIKVWCRERDLPLQRSLLAAGFARRHRCKSNLDDAIGQGDLLIYERPTRGGAATSRDGVPSTAATAG